jgi:broad specificity phosphatase PhoE
MEIVLIRHGRPVAATYPRVNASEFGAWVRAYNHSGVATDSRPPASLAPSIRSHYVVSSTLKRAVESTQICLGQEPRERLTLLRELEIPRYKLPFNIKASSWLYLNRILWTFGLKGPFESYSDAKKRAEAASLHLVKLAKQHEKLVIFSHGYLNFYMRRCLVRQGWQLKAKSSQYWGVTRLVR